VGEGGNTTLFQMLGTTSVLGVYSIGDLEEYVELEAQG
jgi:hypothetical protein